jgi:menaquinone-9 beta-reductase
MVSAVALGISMAGHPAKVKPPIIIGGGVAGLAAAIQMAELGHPCIVLEAGHFPSHKVCGEFFSPECLPVLAAWGVEPRTRIQHIELQGLAKPSLMLDLPVAAASQSRHSFDFSLAQLATRRGVDLRTNTRVKSLQPSSSGGEWRLHLDTGEVLATEKVLVGVGRVIHQFTGQPPPQFPYVGYKTHVRGATLCPHLQMGLIAGGYYGISPIEGGKWNVALLLRREFAPSQPSQLTELVLDRLGATPLMEWLRVEAPPWGLRSTPRLPGLFAIGDALAAIPPISGQGLAMGIGGGILVASYALQGDMSAYQRAWKNQYLRRLRWAQAVHAALSSSICRRFTPGLHRLFPSLVDFCYRQMRL